MTARMGADDGGLFDTPRRGLLREITGIEPESKGVHVRLDEHAGVRSMQRLALGDVGGGIVVGLWPAELKPQAEYLYTYGRGTAMVVAARELDWYVRPNPHLAFFTSPYTQRLYMAPEVDAEEYTRRWEGADARRMGGHYSAEEIRQSLWLWLKSRGYASAEDDDVLEKFLSILGRRKAHLRPAMHFRRQWDLTEVEQLGRKGLVNAVRADVNAILRVAGEPALPAVPAP